MRFKVLIAAVAWAAAPVVAQTPGAAVLSTDEGVRASLARIGARSALWASARARIEALDRRVLVLTPDQIVVREPSGSTDSFDRSTLAEVSPIAGENGRIDVVLVVVNVALLDSLHRQAGTARAAFEADLDRIVIHEVYGHAFPYLLAGDATGRCADPEPGQHALSACSIQRENEVRKEMGLGKRTDYELSGLEIGRYLRFAGSN